MPSNNSEYQREYDKQKAKTHKRVSVFMPNSQHVDLSEFAAKQKMSLPALLRVCADLQMRSAKLRGRAVEEELKELKFLLSNIANNVNQMARHSNRVRQVADEDGLFLMLQEAEKTIENFVEVRLKNSS